MKKFISYVFVFVLGFAACAYTFYHFFGSPNTGAFIQTVPASGAGLKIADGEDNQVRKAAKLVSEYVVNIDTLARPRIMGGPLDLFFPNQQQPTEPVPQGSASGVLFTQDGYILTNNHVVAGADEVIVTLKDGNKYKAKVIGTDPKTDIAVIKIDKKGNKFAKFADSDQLEVGDWVIAVGNPLGLQSSVSLGVVSATKRGPINIEGTVLDQVIQTDAAINRGNSGGALADIRGNLVGINTAIASPSGGSIGIGFAVPSNTVKNIAKQLVEHGKVIRPWLGVVYTDYNAEVKAELEKSGLKNTPKPGGVWIQRVAQNSPAAQAGIQPYDVILKADGKRVRAISGGPI
ncbi:MAG: trypsin-like peptidase domain-containing protein, partial [Armatimonadota bacterium]